MSDLGDANPRSLIRFFKPIGLLCSLDDGKMIPPEGFLAVFQRIGGFWTHYSLWLHCRRADTGAILAGDGLPPSGRGLCKDRILKASG